MAACSEQEVDGKPSEPILNHTSLLSSKIDDSEQHNVHQNSEILKINYNEVEKLNKPQDLKNLSDDEFLNLLEEASTFNKPSNEASDLLQQLRNEIAEKDTCGNVEKTETSHDGTHSALIYGQNRKLQNAFTKGRGSHGMDILLPNTFNDKDTNYILQKSLDNTAKKRCAVINKNRENSIVKGINHSNRLGKTVIQSQSLQDLASTKLDTLESIRNAGIGRGMRKLQKSQRASSFTSSEVSEHAALLQVSVLESVRTSLKDAKTSFGKFRQNSLPAGGASVDKDGSHMNILKRNISSHALVNCAALNVCEVLNSSPERTCNSQKVYSSNSESSCDNPYNKFKLVSSNPNSDLHNLEFNDHSEINIVSPLELELKEIKVRNKSENDPVSEKMIENMYQRRSDNKTFKDNTEVDVSVGFPLTYGHIRSQCNLMQSSIEAVCVDQDLSNITKGIHCEIKSASDEKMQKKKKKNLRQENSEGNPLQEILPSSSFVRSFDDTRQFCSMDINGNPKYHSSTKVPYGITAVLPGSTFDCYSSGGSFHSENHSSKSDLALRKGKRNRNNIDNQKFIMAENIAGHRGEEDIDSLLEFINSSDNKAKTTKTNGTTSNQIYPAGGKHLINNEVDKKKEKLPVKDRMKHYQSCNKKKSNHINSEEEESQDKNEIQDSESNNKCIPISSDTAIKGNSSEISEWNHVNDHSLNTEEKSLQISVSVDSEPNLHEILSESPISISNHAIESKSKISAENCEVSGHTKLEESEFRVVLKKHRKRYPLKKTDSNRYYSGSSTANCNGGHQYFVTKQTSHKDDIMLLRGLPLSHHSQRSKQDCARRKSTSSVPPSEHSSADNSDLDSVHSLPVSGSVPPPTRTHPHTTPPSTSSTPQASYADIARMSIAPTSRMYCNNLYGANFPSNVDKNILSSVNFLQETFDSTNFQEKDGNNNNQFSLPNCSNTDTPANCESLQFLNDSNGIQNNDESLELIVPSNTKSDFENSSKLSKINKSDENVCIPSQIILNKLNPDQEIIETDECSNHQHLHLFNSDLIDVKEIKVINDDSYYKKNHSCNEINRKKNIQKETDSKQCNEKISLTEMPIYTENSVHMYQEIVSTNPVQCLNSVAEIDIGLDYSKLINSEKSANFNPVENEKLLSKSKSVNNESSNNPKNFNKCAENEQVCFGGRQNRPPVIIMDNYLPTENACGVSFGIDLEELLHLSNGSNMITHSSHFINEKATNPSTSSKKSQENEGAKSLEFSCSSVTDTVEIERDNQQPFDSSSSPSSIVFLSNDDSLIQGQNITSSPGSKLVLLKSGQPLHWKEVDTDKQSFNFYQIVGFLGNSGGDIQSNRTEIGFYNDQ